MPNDETRDKLAEWLLSYFQELDSTSPPCYKMADALLAWLKEQPPVISDERAEAVRKHYNAKGPGFHDRRFQAARLLRILGLLDVVAEKPERSNAS